MVLLGKLQSTKFIAIKEVIEGLIKNTQHFTKGAYSNLIESQDMSQKRQTGKYDEEKELQKAIKKIENKEVISYKQIKPSSRCNGW